MVLTVKTEKTQNQALRENKDQRESLVSPGTMVWTVKTVKMEQKVQRDPKERSGSREKRASKVPRAKKVPRVCQVTRETLEWRESPESLERTELKVLPARMVFLVKTVRRDSQANLENKAPRERRE